MKKWVAAVSVCVMVAALFGFALTGSAASPYKNIDSDAWRHPVFGKSASIDVTWKTGGGMTLSPTMGRAASPHITLFLKAEDVASYPYLVFEADTTSTAQITIVVSDTKKPTQPIEWIGYENACSLVFQVIDLRVRGNGEAVPKDADINVDIYLIDRTGSEKIVFNDLYLAATKPTAPRGSGTGSATGGNTGNLNNIDFGAKIGDRGTNIDSNAWRHPMFGESASIDVTWKAGGGMTLSPTMGRPASPHITLLVTAEDVAKNPYLVFEADTASTAQITIVVSDTDKPTQSIEWIGYEKASSLIFEVIDLRVRGNGEAVPKDADINVDIYLIDGTGSEKIIFNDLYLAATKPTAPRGGGKALDTTGGKTNTTTGTTTGSTIGRQTQGTTENQEVITDPPTDPTDNGNVNGETKDGAEKQSILAEEIKNDSVKGNALVGGKTADSADQGGFNVLLFTTIGIGLIVLLSVAALVVLAKTRVRKSDQTDSNR